MSAVVRIAIAGAGSAGYLAACTLRRALRHRDLDVTVVDIGALPNEPLVHWTLPSLRGMHAMLGISETDFVRATGATFKLATEHREWHGAGSRFLHAHGDIGADIAETPFYKYLVNEAVAGRVNAVENYSIAATAAEQGRFARPMGDEKSLTASFTYGFHLEERAYAAYLSQLASRLNVRQVAGALAEVELTTDGDIAALRLADGARITADLFLDCTGSSAALMSRLASVERVDWSQWLPCDRMLTGAAVIAPDAPAMTQTMATDAGWLWRIPLAERAAAGYVFHSAHQSDDSARQALIQAAGLTAEPTLTHLRAGRLRRPWLRNCIAIGTAALELEPLAGANLHAAQLGIGALIELFPVGAVTQIEASEYNRVAAEHADALRDFTLAHYHAGSARTSAFWSALRAVPLPERLADKLDLYFANGRINVLDYETFEETDWAWLLLGSGHVPHALELQIRMRVEKVRREQVMPLRAHVERLVSSMPRHMDFVQHQRGTHAR